MSTWVYFGSKDGLIAAVLDYRHEQFFALVEQALQGVSGADSETAYLDFICAWTRSPQFHGCLFINACAEFSDPNSPFYQQASQHKRQVRELLYRHFVCGDDVDEATLQYAKTLADRTFIFGEGLIVAGQGELVGYFGQAEH
ncbi:TetR/AcrR family transcriptional regulator [Lonepinella koalarum]|uniref:TetR/AcrR family transcriptional regulator n=1 Tax=Lonepinella koalarum TaxID=53417 RepID=UPI003F6DB1DE